jgi:tripartite-type tricarboxylate transporter receptor subunit TctC
MVGPAAAQNYPTQPIKVVSDSAPGSAPDVVLRVFTGEMAQILGQQFVILNKPGAGGSLAAYAAAAAPADGYNLFLGVSSSFVTMKGQAPNIPVEFPGDFTPVSLVSEQPMFVVVAPSTGIKSIPDMIEMAKKKPGEVSYAVSGLGRQSHLTGELIQRRTGTKLITVPYSGGPVQAMGDLSTGRVSALIEGAGALLGPIQAGMIKAIAVGSETRLAEFPDLPAISETLPNFRSAGWLILLAPTATPKPIITKLNEAVQQALAKPDIRKRMAELGSYARALSPEDSLKYIQQEKQTWAPILDEISKTP